jgi:hypothetical protein
VLPALVHVLRTQHQRSLTISLDPIEKAVNESWLAGQLLAHLALGGEAEPRNGEVEAGLPEAVPMATRGEQDGLAVARVGGKEGGRRRGEGWGAGRRGADVRLTVAADVRLLATPATTASSWSGG